MPANPAYLMALPTRNDPMLGYLTTAYQDHVRLRAKFGYKVSDKMWKFFQRLGVIDADGQPTSRFGDPLWVWHQFRRAKGDKRSKAEINREGKQKMKEVRARGVYLAEGFDGRTWKMAPALDREIRALYADAKKSIWVELEPSFVAAIPDAVPLKTRSADRTDYILHPQTGEVLDDPSQLALKDLKARTQNRGEVQIVVSDGLNAHAIMDKGHLGPYLFALNKNLQKYNLKPAPEILVIKSGRVRAGYRIGEILFGDLPDAKEHRAIIHIIGERPGTMHHTFSAYITAPGAGVWKKAGIDHDITRVVSGIADTTLKPEIAARETVKIIDQLFSSR
jgi:ethanolamine ammonia-lyase large subunit